MTSTTLPWDRPDKPRLNERRDRWIAIGVASALHLAILALFLGGHPPVTTGAGVGAGAMDVSLAGFARGPSPSLAHAAPAASAPPSKPAPAAPADPIKPRSVLQIVSDILAIPLPENSLTPQPLVASPSPIVPRMAATASGSPGAACDVGGAVQTALRSDPDSHGAILLIPPNDRSMANAVLLWNGQWIDSAGVGGAAAFAAIRTSIRQIVASAQPDCREREIVGPRFMLIPDGESTIVIVVGTALWRWSDLLVENTPTVADATISPKKESRSLDLRR